MKLTGIRLAAWQIPLGNTVRANDTSGHYRDNRVQWLFAAGGARTCVRTYAGYVGFLFGGGADGTTSADTDGGYFRAHVRAYYRQGALRLP